MPVLTSPSFFDLDSAPGGTNGIQSIALSVKGGATLGTYDDTDEISKLTQGVNVVLPSSPSPPAPGDTIQIRAVATNWVGLTTTLDSDPILLDGTPPTHPATLRACTPGGVQRTSPSCGPSCGGVTRYYQSDPLSLTLCWDASPGFADPESGLLKVDWELWDEVPTRSLVQSSTTSGTVITPADIVAPNPTVAAPISALENGKAYRFKIQPTNKAGTASNGWATTPIFVKVDTTAPTKTDLAVAWPCPLVGDCPSAAADQLPTYQTSLTEVRFQWKGFVDLDSYVLSCEAAVQRKDVTAATSPPAAAWHPLASCSNGMGVARLTGLSSLVDMGSEQAGQRIWVRATNAANVVSSGIIGTLSSGIIYVDTTPPVFPAGGKVSDSADLNSDVDTHGHHTLQAQPLQVCCSWSAFADPNSGLALATPYQWGITSATDTSLAPTVVSWTPSSPTTASNCASFALGQLSPNVVYKCVVTATNRAGGTSLVAASDGFTYDATPPVGGWVIDGSDSSTEAAYLLVSDLDANWGGFNDAEYGEPSVYAVGAMKCSDWNTATLVNVDNLRTAAFKAAKLGDTGPCSLMLSSTADTSECSALELANLHTEPYCFAAEATNDHGFDKRCVRLSRHPTPSYSQLVSSPPFPSRADSRALYLPIPSCQSALRWFHNLQRGRHHRWNRRGALLAARRRLRRGR